MNFDPRVSDKTWLTKAFAEVTRAHGDADYAYVGSDATHHYFQIWGDPKPYTIPKEPA